MLVDPSDIIQSPIRLLSRLANYCPINKLSTDGGDCFVFFEVGIDRIGGRDLRENLSQFVSKFLGFGWRKGYFDDVGFKTIEEIISAVNDINAFQWRGRVVRPTA